MESIRLKKWNENFRKLRCVKWLQKEQENQLHKDFKAELKRVIWPTPKQLVNNTVAVITIVLLTAVIVFVLDVVFETLTNQGINRLRDVVINQSTNTDTNQEAQDAVDNILENETNSTETNNSQAEENTVNE